MGSRSPVEMGHGDGANGDVSSLTVTELITSLKSAFQNTYFSQVEEVLVSREEKLKTEIEVQKKKKELLEEKLQVEVIEKIKVERECTELKRKNWELQSEKLRAETEVEIYKRKFEELEMRVVGLEKVLVLPRVESSAFKDVKISGEVSGEKVVNGTVSCEKGVSVKIEIDATVNLHSTAEDGHRDQDNAGDRKTSENEKVDSRLDVREKSEELVKDEVNVIDRDEKVISKTNSHRNGIGRKIPLPEDIVEIRDSDDESAPHEISSARGMSIQGQIDKANWDQILVENLIGERKRKWASFANKSGNCDWKEDSSRDVNGSCPTDKHKITKVQEHIPITSPFKHSSATGVKFGTNSGGKDFDPSNLGVFLKRGHKFINLQKSELISEKDDSSSSSSSDSDELDLSVDNAIYEIHRLS